MKQIPYEITIPYDALLPKWSVPLTDHVYYKKWLRYYLDFCFKCHHEKLKKESLSHFINKLQDKNQNERQHKQAFHAISIFYEIKKADQDKTEALNNKKEKFSRKNHSLKLMSADWRPVYEKFRGHNTKLLTRKYGVDVAV